MLVKSEIKISGCGQSDGLLKGFPEPTEKSSELCFGTMEIDPSLSTHRSRVTVTSRLSHRTIGIRQAWTLQLVHVHKNCTECLSTSLKASQAIESWKTLPGYLTDPGIPSQKQSRIFPRRSKRSPSISHFLPERARPVNRCPHMIRVTAIHTSNISRATFSLLKRHACPVPSSSKAGRARLRSACLQPKRLVVSRALLLLSRTVLIDLGSAAVSISEHCE